MYVHNIILLKKFMKKFLKIFILILYYIRKEK